MKINYEKFKDILTKKGGQNFLVVLGMLGILLIFISDMDFSKDEKISGEQSLTQYKHNVEKEISALLGEIDGVGEVKVMISFESGPENIYAQQQKSAEDMQRKQDNDNTQEDTRSSYENEFVMVENSGDNVALIEKTVQPTVQGVAVVCSGGDDIKIVSAVTNSVSVVLGVPTYKIFVTKMR